MIRLLIGVLTGVSLLAGAAAAQEMRFPKEYFGRSDLPLPESKIHLEKLMDESDNFEDIARFSQGNRYRQIANPVGRLDLLIDLGGEQVTSTCTAWVIAPSLIMTNYHCVPGLEGEIVAAQLVMNYLTTGQPQAEIDFYEVGIAPVEANQALDYAVVEVGGDPAARYGMVNLDARDPAKDEELFIIHHPMGKPKKITRRNCRNARIAEDGDFHHFCDTLGGSSGSPIFSDNDLSLVGLHYAGLERQYNMAKRLQQIVAQSELLQRIAALDTGDAPSAPAAPAADEPPAPAKRARSDDGAVTGESEESGWGAITD